MMANCTCQVASHYFHRNTAGAIPVGAVLIQGFGVQCATHSLIMTKLHIRERAFAPGLFGDLLQFFIAAYVRIALIKLK